MNRPTCNAQGVREGLATATAAGMGRMLRGMRHRMLRCGLQQTVIHGDHRSSSSSSSRSSSRACPASSIRGQVRTLPTVCLPAAVSQPVRRLVTHWPYSALHCDINIWAWRRRRRGGLHTPTLFYRGASSTIPTHHRPPLQQTAVVIACLPACLPACLFACSCPPQQSS